MFIAQPLLRRNSSRRPHAGILLVLFLPILTQIPSAQLQMPPVNILSDVAPTLDRSFLQQQLLRFIPNVGQVDPSIRFQAQGMGGTLFFADTELVLVLPHSSHGTPHTQPARIADHVDTLFAPPAQKVAKYKSGVVRMQFLGAQPTTVTGSDQLSSHVSYFLGNDPSAWRTHVPSYGGVAYQGIYPGIDVQYNGADGQLKGTYIVSPTGDPTRIHWRYQGVEKLQIDAQTGDLKMMLPAEDNGSSAVLIEQAPVAWQEIDGTRTPVTVRYTLQQDDSVGFALGSYQPAYPLIIDPTIVYSTYIGGNSVDQGHNVTTDEAGNVYVIGTTTSLDFPLGTPLQPALSGMSDIWITGFDPNGTLRFSTYLGGAQDETSGRITVDQQGHVLFTGATSSSNFPVFNAIQSTNAGGTCNPAPYSRPCYDVVVGSLSADGTQLYSSTYLGGSGDDYGNGIVSDTQNEIYITGYTSSSNYPTLNPVQATYGGGQCGGGSGSTIYPCRDTFITKLSANGNQLRYSTYLGGWSNDFASGIVVDSQGKAYIAGSTSPNDFRLINPIQSVFGGAICISGDPCADAFVSVLSPSGNTLIFSTFFGGYGNDGAMGIGLDQSGNVVISGYAEATNLRTLNPIQRYHAGGGFDAFVAKIDPVTPALRFSTYLGGNALDQTIGVAMDRSDNIYLTGWTLSRNFPLTNPAQAQPGGPSCISTISVCYEGMVAKINAAGTQLLYSTYLGGPGYDLPLGIAVDNIGNVYVVGLTDGLFPTFNPQQPAYGGGSEDSFLVKLHDAVGPPTYMISGRIVSNTGIPLGGVAVTANTGRSTVTNADGYYVLGWLPASNYILTASKDGYTFSVPQSVALALTVAANVGNVNFSGTLSEAPPPPPPTSRQAGTVLVRADQFTGGINQWTTTGTVWLGDYVIVEQATITYNAGVLSGRGLITMITSPTGQGRTNILNDSFDVDTNTGMLTPRFVSGYTLGLNQLVGFTLQQQAIQLQINVGQGLAIGRGTLDIRIPGGTTLKEIGFSLDHLGAVQGQISDFNLAVGQVFLHVDQAILDNEGITLIAANFELPRGLGGTKADLQTSRARITAQHGLSFADGSVKLKLPTIIVGTGARTFTIRDAAATLTYRNGTYLFTGAGTFILNGTASSNECSIASAFTLAIPDPPLREVSLAVQGCFKIPIGTTGFFLSGFRGSFQINTNQFDINVGATVTGGPTVPGLGDALQGDVDVHADTSWAFGLKGNMKLFKWDAANADLMVRAKDGLTGSIHLTVLGFIDGTGRIHLWKDADIFHLTGEATVSVQVPAGALFNECTSVIVTQICVVVPPTTLTGPSAQAYFGEFRTPEVASTFGMKGKTRILTYEPAFFLDVEGHVRYDMNGLTAYQPINPNAAITPQAVADVTYTYSVSNASTLLLAMGRDQGNLSFTIVSPSGQVITPATSDPLIGYTTTPTQTLYTIKNPQPGTWQAIVGNRSGNEQFVVRAFGARPTPTITNPPTVTPAPNGYTISVGIQAEPGTTYSLYYDTDRSGTDGIPIATGVPLGQSIPWETARVPSGSYAVYALVDDQFSAPVVAYSSGFVQIIDTTPPETPSGVSVTSVGSRALLSWQPSQAVDIAGYRVTYREPNNGATLVIDIPTTAEHQYTIDGLFLNGDWEFQVSAYDLSGNESPRSQPVTATLRIYPVFLPFVSN